MSERRRELFVQIQPLLAALLILIIGASGYNLLFTAGDGVSLTVAVTDGQVMRTDSSGQREAATAGVQLHPRDKLTVGEGSAAELTIGEGGSQEQTRLTLGSASSIRVVGVDAGGVRVELEEGQVTARVRPEAPPLSITSRGRAVRAEQAEFTIIAAEDGALGVESVSGALSLEGFDGATELLPGHRLSAVPGQRVAMDRIPDALLLKVSWPREAVTRERELHLEGETTPYASIMLDDSTATRAGADGWFRVVVPLQEGENAISVTVCDVMGRCREARGDITRDTQAPSVSTEVIWDQ